MNAMIKYLSLVVFLVIINLSLADLFGVPMIPGYLLKLNHILVIIGAFSYGYAGYKIIQNDKLMKSKIEQTRVKEHKLAETELQYQTNMERLQQELKDTTFQQSALYLKIRDLMTADNPESICTVVMEILEKALNAEKAQLLFRDGADLYVFKHLGMNDDAAKKIRIPVADSSITGWCAVRGQMVTKESISQETQLAALAESGPLRTAMCVPIIINGGSVLGVINVERFGSRKLSKNDRLLLSTLATMAGLALKNADLVEA